MSHLLLRPILSLGVFVVLQSSVSATLISPQVGWQTSLFTQSHNVSGTVTIVDEDTLRFDSFTYDGGGPLVYFYLGATNNDAGFQAGLRIGSELSGTSFDGSQGPITVDLPAGETLEGFHGISVWCERFETNFGSGTFASIAVPEPTTLVLFSLGAMALFSHRRR